MSIRSKIQALITAANTATGQTDTDLTSAVQHLKDGYGQGGSSITEISTAAEMDALLILANVGKIYKFIGTTDENYTNGGIYIVENHIISYPITTTLTNVTASESNPTTIDESSTVIFTFTVPSGYVMPREITDGVTVTGATVEDWVSGDNDTTGTLTISNPTGDVNVTITAITSIPAIHAPSCADSTWGYVIAKTGTASCRIGWGHGLVASKSYSEDTYPKYYYRSYGNWTYTKDYPSYDAAVAALHSADTVYSTGGNVDYWSRTTYTPGTPAGGVTDVSKNSIEIPYYSRIKVKSYDESNVISTIAINKIDANETVVYDCTVTA